MRSTAGAIQSAYTVRSRSTGSPSRPRTRSTYSTRVPASSWSRTQSSAVAGRYSEATTWPVAARPIARAHWAKLRSSAKLWLRRPARTTRRAPCREPMSPSRRQGRDRLADRAAGDAVVGREVGLRGQQTAHGVLLAVDRPPQLLGDLLVSRRHASPLRRPSVHSVTSLIELTRTVIGDGPGLCRETGAQGFDRVYERDTSAGRTEANLFRQVLSPE